MGSEREHFSQNGTTTAKHAPKERKAGGSKNKPGNFAGWISEEWGVAWVVSQHRTDKRTGWVRGEGTHGPMAAKEEGKLVRKTGEI